MKYKIKIVTAIVTLSVILLAWYLLPPSNPIPAEVRQELKRLGQEYTELTLEQARIQKLKQDTSNTLQSYESQDQTYADALKANAEKQAQIKAQYVGLPEAEAHQVSDPTAYLPDDLFYTFPKSWKDSGLVYVTQSQREHFLHNGMLATDIGTSGQALDLFAPDYHGQSLVYRYKRLDSHDTLGHTIKLEFPKEEYGDRYWLLGHVHSFALETGGTVSTGQNIGVTGGCAESVQSSKALEEGASTGCHVHIELWKDGVRLPYPETVGVQHKFEPVSNVYKPTPSVSLATPNVYKEIKLTSYNPAKEQTDASPCIGATGVNLCDAVKANPGLQILALSQDMVSRSGKTPFHYGDKVQLTSTLQDARCNQEAIVLDTMNKRFSKRGDLFFMDRKNNTSCTVTLTKI